MYCYYFQIERDCQGDCTCCPYGYKPAAMFPQHLEFNYECPGCHGKFNNPILTFVLDKNSTFSTGHSANVCPFCRYEMMGL